MNRMHKHEVTSFISAISTRLGMEVGLFKNERRRDGTSVGLEHPDGWFLEVTGGRYRRSEYRPAETGITVRGLVPNPRSGLIEHLSAFGAPADKIWLTGKLQDRDALLEKVCTEVAPAVAEFAGKVTARLHKEMAIAEQKKIVRRHFGLAETEDRKRVALPNTGSVEICVSSFQKDPGRISVGLNIHDLSAEEAEAVLNLIRMRRSN